MRILWLSHLIPYPPKAGVLQRCYYLIKELSKHHEVDVMAFIQPDLLLSFNDDMEEGCSITRLALQEIVSDLEYFQIEAEQGVWGKKGLALKSLFSREGYTMEWLKSDIFSKRLVQKLSLKQYDLVHFDTISLAVYRDLVKNIRVTLDHHNIESHMMRRRASKETNHLKKLYFFQESVKLAGQERKYCRSFDLNITCSDMDTVRLQENIGRVDCVSIPNGVDTEYFKPSGTERRKSSLIFIGTMNWYPNVEAVEFLLERVWPKLRERHTDVSLDVIGSSPPESISRYNGTAGVTIHGFVDDIRPLFDSAHIYICPITDGGGTKLKILDALAMGKAIIANPVACEGIDVTNGQDVILCETETDYINAIERLLADDCLVRTLGENARKLAESRYTFESIGRNLSDVYEKLSKKHTLSP